MNEQPEKTKGTSLLGERLKELSELDNIQKYILGTKKNGAPRAAFDVALKIMDRSSGGKKGKKKHKKNKGGSKDSTYAFYLDVKKGKKHKKGKGDKHWHI